MQEGELLTMGGGVLAEIIYFILIINICAVKNVTTGAPPKFVMGASPKMPPPPHAEKETPPHIEEMAPAHSAHIEKMSP